MSNIIRLVFPHAQADLERPSNKRTAIELDQDYSNLRRLARIC